MKQSSDFIKRQFGKGYAIVAVGEATKRFNGMISVNETGSFIWECLAEPATLEEVVAKMTAEYPIDEETAKTDALRFLETLKSVGAITD